MAEYNKSFGMVKHKWLDSLPFGKTGKLCDCDKPQEKIKKFRQHHKAKSEYVLGISTEKQAIITLWQRLE